MRYWTKVAGKKSQKDVNKQRLQTETAIENHFRVADAMFGASMGPREAAIAGKGTEEALQLLSDLSGSVAPMANASPKGTSASELSMLWK